MRAVLPKVVQQARVRPLSGMGKFHRHVERLKLPRNVLPPQADHRGTRGSPHLNFAPIDDGPCAANGGRVQHRGFSMSVGIAIIFFFQPFLH